MGKKEEIGIRIRTMRKSRRMTQEDLARAIGQSASSITMYETCRRSPDYETLEALADVFNVPISSLVEDEEFQYESYLQHNHAPRTVEARVISRGIDSMPKEQREAIVKLMTGLYPGLFEKGSESDDT